MATFFDILDTLNLQKIILLLEKEKENDKITKLLNTRNQNYFNVQPLGEITAVNTLQYMAIQLIESDNEDRKEEVKRVLLILLKKANIDVLNAHDSRGNNFLHYSALVGDYDITKFILEENVEIIYNFDGISPMVCCHDDRTKKLLEKWYTPQNSKEEHSESFMENISDVNSVHESNESTSPTNNLNDESILNMKPECDVTETENEKIYKNEQDDSSITISNQEAETNANYQISHVDTTLLENHKINHIEPAKINIKKFPGDLYLNFVDIEKFVCNDANVESLIIRAYVNEDFQETKPIDPFYNLEIDQVLVFPIKTPNITVKIYMILNYANTSRFKFVKKTRKVLESSLHIDLERLDQCHNFLYQHSFEWNVYETKNIFHNIKDFFTDNIPKASNLRSYISFISWDEYNIIPQSKPTDGNSLIKWLLYRTNCFIVWFKGYANIRGDNNSVATHLWKRRYIHWYGYKLMIFNECSGVLIGTVDITDAKYICYEEITKEYILENTVKFFDDGVLELQFDNAEKYKVIKNAFEQCLGQHTAK